MDISNLKDETTTLPRNVGNQAPNDATSHRKTETSNTNPDWYKISSLEGCGIRPETQHSEYQNQQFSTILNLKNSTQQCPSLNAIAAQLGQLIHYR